MTLLMAVGLMVFIIGIAVQRHQPIIAALVISAFSAYLAFNVWIFVRMRNSRKS